MAAHIYAASPGGPRGTGGLSAAERRDPENGIWCCYSHGKVIDADAGSVFSVVQLKAWKRLHEARKNAEITGMLSDHFGLVESISVNSAPVTSLAGQKFELGMRNIITSPNESGKTILARLIASVAYPDHVAEMSRHRDVDIGVRWFDPNTHDVATTGRSGNVTHVLDGRPVPYVARPYKTILLNDYGPNINDLVSLSQMFDLSFSAMRGTLSMLAESSDLVREISIDNGTQISWVVDHHGRTVRLDRETRSGFSVATSILLELASVHARYHARVEPTFLLLDGLLGPHTFRDQVALLERLEVAAEHAQVAVIANFPELTAEMSREWTVTALEYRRSSNAHSPESSIDFDIETTTIPPNAVDP